MTTLLLDLVFKTVNKVPRLENFQFNPSETNLDTLHFWLDDNNYVELTRQDLFILLKLMDYANATLQAKQPVSED